MAVVSGSQERPDCAGSSSSEATAARFRPAEPRQLAALLIATVGDLNPMCGSPMQTRHSGRTATATTLANYEVIMIYDGLIVIRAR